MLKNTSTIFIGEDGWEKEVEAEIARNNYTPVILFPMFSSIDEQNIMKEIGKPLNIFVLDTNWKSARRWLHKPILLNVRKIGLKEIPPSEYRLRKESSKNNLCTFQATISLLNELETKDFASTYLQMTENFRLWVKSMAKERGMILKEDNRHTMASL